MAPPNYNVRTDSHYHYIPTKSVCIIFVALFGLSGLIHIVEAFYFRMRWLLATAVLLCIGEAIGWGARYWSSLHWGIDKTPFLIQICATIFSPTFLVAVYFVLLGRIISILGPQYSRLSPKSYLIIFCTADVVALVVQSFGGGLASGKSDPRPGSRIMLGGIIFQMIAMILYILLAMEFLWRYYSNSPIREVPPPPSANSGPGSPRSGRSQMKQTTAKLLSYESLKRIELLIFGAVFSVTCIFIRGVYRTIELSDGWHGRIIATQVYFNVLDGAMILLATITLNILHPGYLLPSET
ncbi:RTA1 like protein [Rickenella mellea]|uniref:RTA1 like protein n=1 Tax=Rickenella mellea TaxID=50990 RepID=A0A4Y7PMB1_9AGAM|nr:RTA1 like protein [Rickenella mellea]